MSQGPVRTMSIYTHFHSRTNHAQCRRSVFKNMYEGFGYTVGPLSLYGTILPECVNFTAKILIWCHINPFDRARQKGIGNPPTLELTLRIQ